MLTVRLIGGFALEHEGAALEPPRSRRARALLAWLALNPGSHARGALAARFWPDVLDESARASLRAALTELRKALGPAADVLLATREAVGLDAGQVRVDALAPATTGPDDLEGELLTGIEGDWVHEARAAHSERLSAALEELAAQAEAAGELTAAAAHTRRITELDALSEEPVRRLMRRLDAAGDRAGALTAYNRLAERLRAQLRIAPSAATRALAEELRARTQAGGAQPPLPAALARATGPFAGRTAELRRLAAAVGDVRMHASRRLVLVAGEPGVGKSRLAAQFARTAHADGAAVGFGRCWEDPLGPYEPFGEVLGELSRAIATPGLDDLVAEAAGDRARLFDRIDELLASQAGPDPLVLVLEDLHWAQRSALLLLRALLLSARPAALLVVATYRATELGRSAPLTALAPDLRRDGAADQIQLASLEPGDVTALARDMLGDGSLGAEIHARTGGNALFVEESLRALADGREDPVPESVRHAIAARAARLGEAPERLLAVAAVLGAECDPHVLSDTAELDEPEAALDTLLKAGLLRPCAGGARVEFPHAMVRDAVYADINALRRAGLHRRAADALQARGEERHLEEIAHHLAQAASPADVTRTTAMLELAGRRALSRLAYEEAGGWFTRAIDSLQLLSQSDAGLLLARGDALLRAGQTTAARGDFERAAQLARGAGDTVAFAHAALGAGGLGVAIRAPDPTVEALLGEALQRLGDDQPVLRSRLLSRLAVELFYAPSRDRSETLSEQAVTLARASADPLALTAALNARRVALWRPDRLTERLAVVDEMLSLARGAGDRESELQALNWQVTDRFEQGDMRDWQTAVQRHCDLADELRLPTYQWYRPLWAAVAGVGSGDHDRALHLVAEAEAAGRRAGDGNAELFASMLRSGSEMARGIFSDWAFDVLATAAAESPAAMAYRSCLAWYLAEWGRDGDAREQLGIVMNDDLAGLPFDMNWASAMGEMANAIVRLGDVDAAEPIYDHLLPYAGRQLVAGRAIVTYGFADRPLGELAALLGRTAEARRHLEAALELHGREGLTDWLRRSESAYAALSA